MLLKNTIPVTYLVVAYINQQFSAVVINTKLDKLSFKFSVVIVIDFVIIRQ